MDTKIDFKQYGNYIIKNWDELVKLPKLSKNEILESELSLDKQFLLAVYYGHLDLIMDMMGNCKNNIYFNVKTDHGTNAYLIATKRGENEIMQFLENNGFDIHIKNNYGRNAYMAAARNGNLDIMKHLESKGIDIYVKDKNGDDVYLWAAYDGHLHVMEHLESINYYIYVVNNNGNDAFDEGKKHLHIVEHLKKIHMERAMKGNKQSLKFINKLFG